MGIHYGPSGLSSGEGKTMTCKSEKQSYPEPAAGSLWWMPRSTSHSIPEKVRFLRATTTYSGMYPSYLVEVVDLPAPPINITARSFHENATPVTPPVTVSFNWLLEHDACKEGIAAAIHVLQINHTKGIDYEFSLVDLMGAGLVSDAHAAWILVEKEILPVGLHSHEKLLLAAKGDRP